MRRAQVFQAEACGLKPSVAMNPILLKPSSDNNSQIIAMGRPVANADAKNYYRNKETYFKEAISAFESLRQSYDLIVLEGAGSPAEINLKEHDIVNMRMAKLDDAANWFPACLSRFILSITSFLLGFNGCKLIKFLCGMVKTILVPMPGYRKPPLLAL